MSECSVCKSAAQRIPSSREGAAFDCPRCGRFFASGRTKPTLERLEPDERKHLSSWIRWNSISELMLEDIDKGLAAKRPGLLARAEKLLLELNRQSPNGKEFRFNLMGSNADQIGVIVWAVDKEEIRYLLKEVLCESLSYVSTDGSTYKLTPNGLLSLEGKQSADTSVGFVAMWFSAEVNHLYDEVFSKAIVGAGFQPNRIDRHEHNDKIDDEIVAAIRKARFLIADFTGHRGGVYYETGLAHGLGKQVIFCCREDQIENLHFDVRQYNCILWKKDDLSDFSRRLKNRILATIPGASERA
jgi:hypothetical protein